MPFEPGHPKLEGAGRPAGSPNKRSLKALEIAQEHSVCPITFWCNVVNDKYPEATFEHKMAAMKELAPYIYAKLKQIEHTGGEGISEFFAKLLGGNGSNP
jgi:hypothetical protein